MMLLGVLCLLTTSACVAGSGFQMNIQRPTEVQHDTYGHQLSSTFGHLYLGFVSVGNPPQPFKVIIDTGSEQTWVPAKGCELLEAADRPVACPNGYDFNASTTAVDLGKPYQSNYMTGGTTGKLYEDEFMLGNAKGFRTKTLKLKNKFQFGAASTIYWRDNGILALSPPEAQLTGTSLIEQLVNDGQLDKPIFTMFLANCLLPSCPQGGIITFGALDEQNCGPVLGYAPVDEFVLKWRFFVEHVEFNSRHPVSRRVQKIDFPVPSYPGPIHAFTDSGSQVLQMPVADFKDMVTAMGLQPFEQRDDIYLIECDRPIEMKMKINGMNMVIPRTQLIDQNRFTNVNNNGRATKMCALNIEATDWNAWVLGDPFMRSYCVVHDYDKKSLGFAPVKKAA